MNIPKLEEAMAVWQQLAEEVDSNGVYVRASIKGHDLRMNLQSLKEGIVLDPEGVTTSFLLQYYANEYFKDLAFSAFDILTDIDSVYAQLEPVKRLFEYGRDQEVVAERLAFIDNVRAAVKTYCGETTEDLEKVYASAHSIAFLRRDALRSIACLRVDQFADGTGAERSDRIMYDPVIRQWWNVNSLLGFASTMPNGVSMHAIRNPAGDFGSFFCFAVRVNARVFIVSDTVRNAHPLQSSMSRRPDRQFEERAGRNWFPYDKLNVAFDEEANRMFQTDESGLIPQQVQTAPFMRINELSARQMVWTALMFELLAKKFWSDKYVAPQLSYVAGSCRSNPEMQNLVPEITVEATAQLTGTDDLGDQYKPTGRQLWLADRYKDQIPQVALNLLADPSRSFELQLEHKSIVPKPTRQWGDQVPETTIDAKAFDGTAFGTAAELVADRNFVARYNYATTTNRLARLEYNCTREELVRWYTNRVHLNMPEILSWCVNDRLYVRDVDSQMNGTFRQHGDGTRSYLFMAVSEEIRRHSGKTVCIWHSNTFEQKPLCFTTGVAASFDVMIQPSKAEHLAVLAGCTVDELPECLRTFSLHEPYRGNCILDRIDPVAWAVRDPWHDFPVNVRFWLSKRALTSLRKGPAKLPAIAGAGTEADVQRISSEGDMTSTRIRLI